MEAAAERFRLTGRHGAGRLARAKRLSWRPR
jgi:hypothetical protein